MRGVGLVIDADKDLDGVLLRVLHEGFRTGHARQGLDGPLPALEERHALGADVPADLVVALGRALDTREVHPQQYAMTYSTAQREEMLSAVDRVVSLFATEMNRQARGYTGDGPGQ